MAFIKFCNRDNRNVFIDADLIEIVLQCPDDTLITLPGKQSAYVKESAAQVVKLIKESETDTHIITQYFTPDQIDELARKIAKNTSISKVEVQHVIINYVTQLMEGD